MESSHVECDRLPAIDTLYCTTGNGFCLLVILTPCIASIVKCMAGVFRWDIGPPPKKKTLNKTKQKDQKCRLGNRPLPAFVAL